MPLSEIEVPGVTVPMGEMMAAGPVANWTEVAASSRPAPQVVVVHAHKPLVGRVHWPKGTLMWPRLVAACFMRSINAVGVRAWLTASMRLATPTACGTAKLVPCL